MRALLCVDGAQPDHLLDRAVPYLTETTEYLAVHVVDTRGRVELGLLRAGVPGAGPLGADQRAAIEAAGREHARAVLLATEEAIRMRGLVVAGMFERLGEPGREICSLALTERVDVTILLAKRRRGPSVGPPSVGHTARYVVDHAPCPVLLLRGR